MRVLLHIKYKIVISYISHLISLRVNLKLKSYKFNVTLCRTDYIYIVVIKPMKIEETLRKYSA